MAMIGTRHYERIMTLPSYAICRKTLAFLALLLGILPVLLYIIALHFAALPADAGPRIGQTTAVVLAIFLAIIALICPLMAAVLNRVLTERNIGRPPFRFLYAESQEEVSEGEEQSEKKPFESQFGAMSAILFAISDSTAVFGLVVGALARSWGYGAPFLAFSLIFSGALYFMLKNQLFNLMSQHFDMIEGGGKAQLAE